MALMYPVWSEIKLERIQIKKIIINDEAKYEIIYVHDDGTSGPLKFKIMNLVSKFGINISQFKWGALEMGICLDESDPTHMELYGNGRFKPKDGNSVYGFYHKLRLKICELLKEEKVGSYPEDDDDENDTKIPVKPVTVEKKHMHALLSATPSDKQCQLDSSKKLLPKRYTKKYKGSYYLLDKVLRAQYKNDKRSPPIPERGVIPDGVAFMKPSAYEYDADTKTLKSIQIKDLFGKSIEFDAMIHIESVGFHLEKFAVSEKLDHIVVHKSYERTTSVNLGDAYTAEEIMEMTKNKRKADVENISRSMAKDVKEEEHLADFPTDL